MRHAKDLLLSWPFLTRVPDDTVLVTERVPTRVPGAGRNSFSATRDSEGSFAMVYVPVGRRFNVHMEVVHRPRIKAWWFNPRTGKANAIGEFNNSGEREFNPPDPGEELDWILVLDDAARGFGPPGRVD